MKYGIHAAPFSGGIHVGKLNKAETMFVGDKEDCTDMVLAAVADFARKEYGGKFEADFSTHGGFKIRVEVEEVKSDDR